jgi:hypothetical protein
MMRYPEHGIHGLITRADTAEHAAHIGGPYVHGAARRARDIIELAYYHQPAVYETNIPPFFGTYATGQARMNQEYIARLLYEKHYRTDVNLSGAGLDRITPDAFAESVFLTSAQGKRNRVSFLIGDVGCGKSALINHLVTRFGKSWVEQHRRWFVKLNIETLRSRPRIPSVPPSDLTPPEEVTPLGLAALLENLARKARLVVQGYPLVFPDDPRLSQLDRLLSGAVSSRDSERITECFANFVRGVSTLCDREPILILDNIDFLIHEYDRGLYSERNLQSLTRLLHNVFEFIERLWPGAASPLSDLGANVLIVVRPETHELISSMIPPLQNERRVGPHQADFRLGKLEPEIILDSRYELIKELLPVLGKGGDNDAAEYVRGIELPNAGNSKKILSALTQLTNYGMRDLVTHVASILALPAAGDRFGLERIGQRVLEHPPITLLTFMLGWRRRFSQSRSSFANIYLVNLRAGERDVEGSVFRDHVPSYWLKRLIMEFVCQRQHQSRDQAVAGGLEKEVAGFPTVAPEEVMTVFAGPVTGASVWSRRPGYYQRGLVRAMFGSLTDASQSNLLEAQRAVAGNGREIFVSGVEATLRGEYSRRELFDRFSYLQLVVEDDYLWTPLSVTAEYLYKTGVDYGYIGGGDAAYREGTENMIRVKIKQVALLMIILEEALSVEQACYYRVFEHLGGAGIRIPKISEIAAGVAREIEALNRALSGSVVIDFLRVVQASAQQYRESIRQDLWVSLCSGDPNTE